MNDDLRYPIGRFEALAQGSGGQVEEWISELERFPALLRHAARRPRRLGGLTSRESQGSRPNSAG